MERKTGNKRLIAGAGKIHPVEIGQAVKSMPTTLAYFCGDRTGKVEAFDGASILVRMDQSGKLTPFHVDQLELPALA